LGRSNKVPVLSITKGCPLLRLAFLGLGVLQQHPQFVFNLVIIDKRLSGQADRQVHILRVFSGHGVQRVHRLINLVALERRVRKDGTKSDGRGLV